MKNITPDCGTRNHCHFLKGKTFAVICFVLLSLNSCMSQSASPDSNPSPNTQSTAILVEPGVFFWRVNSISLEWKVQETIIVDHKSATSWSFENSSEFVNRVKSGTRDDAGVNLSLGIFPIANASIYAKAGVWAEGSLAWGSSQQKNARECSAAFKSSSLKKENQQVSFSIWFYNKSTNAYEIINATIPICINGNEHVAMAKVHKTYDTGNGTIIIPANRPKGVPIRFVADLDTTHAESLVDYLQDNSPSITLGNSQVIIHKLGEPAIADIIPYIETLEDDSVPVGVKTDAIVMSWRVYKRHSSTLNTVLDAINEKMRQANDNKQWITYDHNGITGIGGETKTTNQEWKMLVNGQESTMGNPAVFVVNQAVEFFLFVTPPRTPSPEPPVHPSGSPPPKQVVADKSMLIGTWKWRDMGATFTGIFYKDDSVYLEYSSDEPTWREWGRGKGTWNLDGNLLTVEMNRIGRFGVYISYEPVKWIYEETFLSITEKEIILSGKTLKRQ